MSNILFVNSSLSDGGSERVMTLLANKIADMDNDVTMVLLRERKVDTYQLSPKIACVRMQYGTSNKLLIAIKRIPKLRKIIHEGKYDCVISFMYDINMTTLIAALGLGQRIVVSERADPSARNVPGFYSKIENYMYGKSKAVVFQTEQVRQMYPEKIRRRSTVIPNPISDTTPPAYEGIRDKRIVAAGRFSDQKNFPMLIRAFARFRESHPEYRLEIFGEGGLRGQYEALVAEWKLEDSVSLPGYVSDVNERMQSAGMYVSSSDFEGISNAMLEALAMGIPSICTDCPVGGAALAIENGVNGILIPVGDEDALVQAMTSIADDPAYAAQLSAEAAKVRETFSIDRIAEMWLAAIDE